MPESNYSDTLYVAGEYDYFVSAVYGTCELDTNGTKSISLFTEISQNENSDNIILYPNPAGSQLNIILTAK